MRVSDLFGFNDYSVQITVENTPPTFNTSLTDSLINVGSFVNYTLPILYDAENQTVTITA
jgi:hypothetical protein